jgi:hypothetical protein
LVPFGFCHSNYLGDSAVYDELPAEIERLRADVERLRADVERLRNAMEPVKLEIEAWSPSVGSRHWTDEKEIEIGLTISECRKIAAALAALADTDDTDDTADTRSNEQYIPEGYYIATDADGERFVKKPQADKPKE